MLAFDTETYRVMPGLLAPPVVCFSFCVPSLPPWLMLRDEGLERLEHALDEGEVTIGHRVAYDFAVACAARESLIPKVFRHYGRGLVRDTALRQQLLDIESGLRKVSGKVQVWREYEGGAGRWEDQVLSLAALESRYLGIDRSADKTAEDRWQLRYHELDGVPLDQWPPEAVRYARDDASGTLGVYLAQQAEAHRRSYAADVTAIVNEVEQTRKAWALHLIACWGMRTDGAAVQALEAEVDAKWAELQKKFRAAGFFRLEALTAEERREGRKPDGYLPGRLYKTKPQDPPKPAKLVRDMEVIRSRVVKAYEALGDEVPKTDKGAVATDRDCLTNSGDELLGEFGEGGPIATIRQTFLPTLRQGSEKPINTNYNPLLETGRISSSKPNLNNIPRDGGVRECFVPRPGFVLASVDYSSAELRAWGQIMLWLFKWSPLAQFYQQNPDGDPHVQLAATFLGIPPEEATARYKAEDPEVSHARQVAKPFNLGLYGGLGIKKFKGMAKKQYGVDLPETEIRKRKLQMLNLWGAQPYFDWVSSRVGKLGGPLGHMRPPGFGTPHRVRGGVGYTDGCNGLIQGLTADGAGEAVWRVAYECYVDRGTALFGCRIIVFLYDELILEVPEDTAHEAAYRLRDVMVESMQAWTPDVPCVAEPCLMTRWYKKAKEKFDADGRLIPWR